MADTPSLVGRSQWQRDLQPLAALEWKKRYNRKGTSTSKHSVLPYTTIATKLSPFVGNSHGVPRVEFQENGSNGSRDTAENFDL
jgi:hypothetical protein